MSEKRTRILGDTKDLPNDEWLEWRKHGPNYMNDPSDPVPYIPFTCGGSDVAAVFGISPWTTNLQLFNTKLGTYIPPVKMNILQLENGHLMEPIIAHFFEEKTGCRVREDTYLYQNVDHPYFLANIDRRFTFPDGREGILEIKTTSFHKRDAWSDKQVPVYYEYQLRSYLATLDEDYGAFACMWGMNPETDMAIVFIERDREKEKVIFDTLDDFIRRLENNEPPEIKANDAEMALKSLADMYKCNPDEPAMELSVKRYGKLVENLCAIQTEKNEIDRKSRELEKKSLEIQKSLADALRTVTCAVCGDYLVTYRSKSTTRADKSLLMEAFGDDWKKYAKTTESRPVKVTRKKAV